MNCLGKILLSQKGTDLYPWASFLGTLLQFPDMSFCYLVTKIEEINQCPAIIKPFFCQNRTRKNRCRCHGMTFFVYLSFSVLLIVPSCFVFHCFGFPVYLNPCLPSCVCWFVVIVACQSCSSKLLLSSW